MADTNTIPERKDVAEKDKWDLSTLYKSNEDWEKALSSIPELTSKVIEYKGKLSDSSNSLLEAMKALENLYKVLETVSNYAGLQYTADEGDASAQDRDGRATMAYSKALADISFFDPELMAIDDSKINEWKNLPEYKDYKIFIEKSLHYKPYTLSEKEERLLSLNAESSQTARNTFSLLTNVDLSFGTVVEDDQEKPLTQSTWSLFMQSPNREIRKQDSG